MKRWQLTLLAGAAALGLAACDVQVNTAVKPPRSSLPDTASPGPGASAPAPVTTASAGDNAATTAQAPLPDASATTAQAPLPDASANVAAAPAPEASAPVADASAPQTHAMGASAPDPDWANVPAGTAASTEVSRFLDGTAPAAHTSSAAPAPNTRNTTQSGDNAKAGAAPKPGARVSQDLPAVRDPGDREGAQLLAQRALEVPVVGIRPAALADNYGQTRGQRKHEAIDILAAAGTPVVAVDDGRIAKLFNSKAGGLTIYQFDRASRLAYYYAHLQRYADNVREGMDVKRGDLIGYVGSSGNADAKVPHLHFAVFRLDQPPKWWEGAPVNPYPALSVAEAADQVTVR